MLLGLPLSLVVGPHVLPLAALHDFSYDFRDAYIFLWNSWWLGGALSRLQDPFWTDRILHPDGASLAFHSNPLPYALVSLPLQRVIGGTTGLVIGHNLSVLLSFALCAVAAYRLAFHVTRDRGSAIVAALIYALAPYRFLNTARLHVLATELIPFAVLSWLKLTERPSGRQAVFVAIWTAVTFYTSLEYALFLILFFGLWLLYQVGAERGRGLPALGKSSLFAAAAFLVLAAPLLLAQARALRTGGANVFRPLSEVRSWSPAALGFFIPSRFHPVYGPALDRFGEYGSTTLVGMRSETSIGLAVWVLAVIGLVGGRRQGASFWGVSAGVFLLLTLGPYLRLSGAWETGVPLPYLWLYELVPPLRSGRDPTRLFPMALLSMSVLAAFGVRALRAGGRGRFLPLVLVAGVVLLESLTVRPGSHPAEALVPPLYGQIHGEPGSAVLDLSHDLEALLAQTVHGQPVTAGREAVPRAASARRVLPAERDLRHPRSVLDLPAAERAARVAAHQRTLGSLGIRYVVLPQENDEQRELLGLLGAERVPSPGEAWHPLVPPPTPRNWSEAASLFVLPY